MNDAQFRQGRAAGEAEPLTTPIKNTLGQWVRGSFPPDPCPSARTGFGAAPQGLALSLL